MAEEKGAAPAVSSATEEVFIYNEDLQPVKVIETKGQHKVETEEDKREPKKKRKRAQGYIKTAKRELIVDTNVRMGL